MVKDIQKRYLSKKFSHPRLKDIRWIAVDEIAVKKGHKYLTVVLDLETGAVIFVGDGKGADALLPFWKRLKHSPAAIKAVAIDMSPAYISAVMDHLPEASIVFDHFHVIKLYNDKLSDLRRDLHREATDQLQKDVLKGTRWLLLKNPAHLDKTKGEEERLREALKLNEPLYTERRPLTGMASTQQESGDERVGYMDREGRFIWNQDAHDHGKDPCIIPVGHSCLLRLPHLNRSPGRDEQQNKDHETAGIRVQRYGVLQVEDNGAS